MRLRNQTRTGNICNQNIAREWLHFGMIYVLLLLALRRIWQIVSAGVGGRQSGIGTVLTLQFPPYAFSALLHGVGQDTEALDLHFEDIAGLHEHGRLTRRSAATLSDSGDHISSLQT